MQQQDDQLPHDKTRDNFHPQTSEQTSSKDSDSEAAVERGKAAIRAEQEFASRSEQDQQKDAAKWRNEG